MKNYRWLCSLGLSFFILGQGSLAAAADTAVTEEPACRMQNDELLNETLPLIWKNGQETAVQLVFLYQSTDGVWSQQSLQLAGGEQQSFDVMGRCVYWYAKRGKSFYAPTKQKNNESLVTLAIDGKTVKSAILDLQGKEHNTSFTFTLR